MTVPLRNETFLRVGFMLGQRKGGQPALTAMIKGTFALSAGAVVRAAQPEAQQPLLGDTPWDADDPGSSCRYASDFVPFKARADAILAGTCHVPRGGPRTVSRVSFSVGSMHKAALVSGDRHWLESKAETSDPRPFSSMPLRYENAFGGPGFAANPCGKGIAPDQDGRIALPNLEQPGALIRSPEDRPNPAGFGAIDRQWAQRTRKQGTYGGAWLAERWPWLPDDADASIFNAAPADQTIEGYLRGDEPLVFEGFHADVARFQTRLPGLLPRCFAERHAGASADFEEIALSLDTLWVDTEAGQLVLVWRGAAPVRSRDFDDVASVTVVAEQLSETRRPVAFYREHAARSAPREPRPETEEAVARPGTSADRDAPTEPADARILAEARALLNEAGAFPELEKRIAGTTTIETLLGALNADFAAPDPGGAARAQATTEEANRKTLEDPGVDASAFEQRVPPADFEAPDPSWTREKVSARAAAGSGLAGANLEGLDLSGIDLSGVNLSGAKLTRAKLGRANLAKADLSGAVLAEAELRTAVLRGVVACGADFRRADLTGADLSQATLDGARFEGAKLEQAWLSGADLTRASLSGADLEAALLEGALLDGADLRGSVLRGVRGKGARLRRTDLTEADLQNAILDDAVFAECTLDGTKFGRASLARARFAGSHGEGVTMALSDLTETRFEGGSVLAGAHFEKARANGSIWLGAELAGADFGGATLVRASFVGANLTGASFHLALLQRANFTKANLARAKLTKANLLQARLAQADLTGADCRASNFFECELWEATTTNTRFERSNLARTKLADRSGA